MGLSFQPLFSDRPISELVYVANQATPRYIDRLRDVGKRLNVPVHLCVGNGGIHSEKFRRNWERRIELGTKFGDDDEEDDEDDNRKSGHSLPPDLSRKNNDDDDRNDDEDDDDPRALARKDKKEGDACAEFIAKMVRQHCATSTHGASRRYVKNVIGRENKNHGSYIPRTGGKTLAQNPKLGATIRKTKSFLQLRDKPLQNLGFLAHAPRRSAAQPIGPSGAVTTRSQTAAAVAAAPSVTAATTTRPPPGKKRKINAADAAADAADAAVETPLTDESRINLERRLRENEAEDHISFRPETLILLDDALVPIDPLKHGNADAVREERDRYLTTVQWITKICLQDGHHLRLHLAVTSQSLLSSSGSSNAISRAFRTIRQNLDSHIIFFQPLQGRSIGWLVGWLVGPSVEARSVGQLAGRSRWVNQ